MVSFIKILKEVFYRLLQALDYSKASHYILQYIKQTKDYTFRTELFYKKYDSLYKTDFNNNGREVAANNNGYGDAKGAEVFWRDKKTIKNVDYWISYSYLRYKKRLPEFSNSDTAFLCRQLTQHHLYSSVLYCHGKQGLISVTILQPAGLITALHTIIPRINMLLPTREKQSTLTA